MAFLGAYLMFLFMVSDGWYVEDMDIWWLMWSAAGDVDVVKVSNPANALPTVFSHSGEVFHAVEVDGNIFSFLMGGLLTDGVGFVNVIDALDFFVMGAAVCADMEGGSEGDKGEQQ